ncbi:hypothetical protein TcasGA2_TC034567 [Tribolium castaneum]|uniref:Uncharacterized protein n=1 Tax=Tribolium castaneum TaxID=7070 RepID=A0A139WMI3_TRICA|nr:hypothetical protein TcasGA2_TC034567 [Tribolium castaneum]
MSEVLVLPSKGRGGRGNDDDEASRSRRSAKCNAWKRSCQLSPSKGGTGIPSIVHSRPMCGGRTFLLMLFMRMNRQCKVTLVEARRRRHSVLVAVIPCRADKRLPAALLHLLQTWQSKAKLTGDTSDVLTRSVTALPPSPTRCVVMIVVMLLNEQRVGKG